MLFNVGERILLLNVIPPAEGTFLFLREVRELRESLGFTAEEAAEIGLKAATDRVTWDSGKNSAKEIAVGSMVADYISKSIMLAKDLREEHMEFYLRFVQEEQ